MLRENLDTVLKDLLEFKSNEKVTCIYPGPNLALDDNFLQKIPPTDKDQEQTTHFVRLFGSVNTAERRILNKNTSHDLSDTKTEIINRIRRYLDLKTKGMLKPISKVKYNIHKYFGKKDKLYKRIKRFDKTNFAKRHKKRKIKRRFLIQSKQIRIGRKLQLYTRSRRRRQKNIDDIFSEEKIMNFVDPANGDATLKARFLFKSCMSYEILEKRGHQPLLDLLNLLGGWPILNSQWNGEHFDWLELMAKLRLYNNDILISEWVGPDIKNSDEFVIQFDQTSLGKINFILN